MNIIISLFITLKAINKLLEGGGAHRSDNGTIETSRHCDMCFGSPAIWAVHSKVPPRAYSITTSVYIVRPSV